MTTQQRKVALVAGAQGVIGRNLIEHLSSLPDWETIGLSRREGTNTNNVRYISVDLLDESDAARKLGSLTDVTHIFYAAYQDRPTWAELTAPNLIMLKNVVEHIEPVANRLKHISLMQGYKVYGAHLGPFQTPARELDGGRHMRPEFNVDQQLYLEAKQQGKSWSWTAIRPSVVGGVALGNPMNLALAIAVYASISKEMKIPLRFPGKPGAYNTILEMTDAGLLAKGTAWAATDAAAANQAFNITNGDLFRWNGMWPRIAAYFQMETAAPLPMSLSTMMADKKDLWAEMRRKYNLTASYEEVSSWNFADIVFSWDYDMFADSSKVRRFGFHEYVASDEMFFSIFDNFKRQGVIPTSV